MDNPQPDELSQIAIPRTHRAGARALAVGNGGGGNLGEPCVAVPSDQIGGRFDNGEIGKG